MKLTTAASFLLAVMMIPAISGSFSMMKVAGIQHEGTDTKYRRFPDDDDYDDNALSPLSSWKEDLFPLVMFNYHTMSRSKGREQVFLDELEGKSFHEKAKSLPPHYDVISYIHYTNNTRGGDIQAVFHNFWIGVATDKPHQQATGVRHVTSSSFVEMPVLQLNEGVQARVLAGKAFHVSGSSLVASTSRYSQSVSIIDFEMSPYSSTTFYVPQGLDTAVLYVYGGGYIQRLNQGERNWVMSQTAVVLDATAPHSRGVHLEAGREGCKVLVLAATRHHGQPQQYQDYRDDNDNDDNDELGTNLFPAPGDCDTDEIELVWSDSECWSDLEPNSQVMVAAQA